ncbi:MAG: tetratricopeptide repeat protein [Dehalococcoidales bacterium]|nr:tetratricopeptide repeat protein [Dehalococcoidales bacterium]
MSYQENKSGKLKRQSSKQAITLAMEGKWQESIDINKAIIEHFPKDADAHNRLGKAYIETGEYNKAREAYEQALAIDQYNTIAKKNLLRLTHLAEEPPVNAEGNTQKAEPKLFIEEIGKAGVLNLYQIAPSELLVKMTAGDKVTLQPQGSSLAVLNSRGEYLGLVPSKNGQRLIKLMEGGNKYTAAIVASSEKSISVIIREIYQDPSQINQVSFPGKRLEEILPYGNDRVFRSEFEEEEDLGEAAPFIEESGESSEELIEDVDEDKEWEQEG